VRTLTLDKANSVIDPPWPRVPNWTWQAVGGGARRRRAPDRHEARTRLVSEHAAAVADAELMFGHAISARLRTNPEDFCAVARVEAAGIEAHIGDRSEWRRP